MIGQKILINSCLRRQYINCMQSYIPSCRQKYVTQTYALSCRFLSSHHITKNIEYLSHSNNLTTVGANKNSLIKNQRPLLLMICWLLANRKHAMKFANLYIEQGFDVVMVSVSPWQLMWPIKGTRIVAGDLLSFLLQNDSYQRILIHGFSVGGYFFGEMMDLMQTDRKKFDPVIDRFVGQVWDSAADVTELTIGTPRAVFPKNKTLQGMMKKYLEYHMKTFDKQATQYYVRSSQLFHTTIVHAPALFLVSNTDVVGSLESNTRVRDSWDSLGMKTYTKVFDKSPHVGHFRKYPKEYVAELYTFLSKLDLIQNEEKIRARL